MLDGTSKRLALALTTALVLAGCGEADAPREKQAVRGATEPKKGEDEGDEKRDERKDERPANEKPDTSSADAKDQGDGDDERKEGGLLLVMNGFNSCGTDAAKKTTPKTTDMYKELEILWGKLAESKRKNAAYLISCFTKTSQEVHVVSSATPDEIALMPVAKYLELARNLAAQRKGKVAVVGHSYGGWLAMKTAAALTERSGIDLDTLVTIDPISPATCSPANFLDYLKGQLSSLDLGRDNPGCDKAPSDFDGATIGRIASEVGEWKNYYQTAFKPLHSGEIPEAKTNEVLSVSILVLNAHSAVDSDPKVWTAFTQRVERAL